MKNTSLFLLQNAATLMLQHPHLASLFLVVTLSLQQVLFSISCCSADWILQTHQPDMKQDPSQG